MKYVYLLSTYSEYGAENPHATLDRGKLIELLAKHFAMDKQGERFLALPDTLPNEEPSYRDSKERVLREEEDDRQELIKLLSKPDEELADRDGHNVSNGWGGVQLHVIPLE